jgi:3-dehydroquinate dehydratase/shikimate dehydrogenase
MARAKNIQVIPGLEMFVQQGARQFEIWTGKPAPVAEMAYVVTKALERQAAQEVVEEDEKPAPKKAAKKVVGKKAVVKKAVVKKAVKAVRKK